MGIERPEVADAQASDIPRPFIRDAADCSGCVVKASLVDDAVNEGSHSPITSERNAGKGSPGRLNH